MIEDLQTKQDLLNFLRQQQDREGSKSKVSAWTAVPALQSGWTGSASYRVNPETGIVDFRGQISPGTATDGTLIFTMPAGARPVVECVFVCVHRGGTGGTSWIRVQPDGTVRVTFGGSGQASMDLAPLRYSIF